MIRILLDQGLPRSTAALLRQSGLDVLHVGEIGMSSSPDQDIIEYARANGYTIVTLDADFHALVAVTKASGPSVIRLRMQRLNSPEAAMAISTVLNHVAQGLGAGCFVTVTPTTIRIRRLPLLRRE